MRRKARRETFKQVVYVCRLRWGFKMRLSGSFMRILIRPLILIFIVIVIPLLPATPPQTHTHTHRRPMSPVFDHEKLTVYREAVQYVAWVDGVLETLPKGLAVYSQLDRAATSIPLRLRLGRLTGASLAEPAGTADDNQLRPTPPNPEIHFAIYAPAQWETRAIRSSPSAPLR